jgi:hypothetical protein
MICKVVYGDHAINASYKGVMLGNGFEEYLASRVKDRLYDVQGTEELVDEFGDIVETGFEKEILVDVFRVDLNPDSWKIGEALAECYLEDHEGVRFHYNDIRDAKNPKASFHGADLVGFVDVNGETIFLFGEVKTSSDRSSPPQVLYGRSGMVQQLEDIKNNSEKRKSLIRWLGFKVNNLSDEHPFKIDYKNALTVYLNYDQKKIKLVGILVRDTEPLESDVKSRYEKLKDNLQKEMCLELFALYIPISIDNLKDYVSNGVEDNGQR